jgi:hypothetical protein
VMALQEGVAAGATEGCVGVVSAVPVPVAVAAACAFELLQAVKMKRASPAHYL